MTKHLRTSTAWLAAAAVIFLGSTALAGEIYPDPPGGWDYFYDGDSATAGPANDFDSLDGTWDHDNGSDKWDGTGIGSGSPGGAVAMTAGVSIPGLDWLRIQDTGDPRDYAMGDPSNRKVMFAHDATGDVGTTPLDTGVTMTFRARLSTTAPLDDSHPDGGGGTSAWPTGGDGYAIHDSGKGIGFQQSDGGSKAIGFHLALPSDDDALSQAGLVMNSLNGTSPTGDVDTGEGTLNILPLNDVTDWHEFWITIAPGGTGTHQVSIYADGATTPQVFDVTAGSGNDYDETVLTMGLGATGQSGAIDIDFIAYKGGVHPVPEPATLIMLLSVAVTGLAMLRRRRA